MAGEGCGQSACVDCSGQVSYAGAAGNAAAGAAADVAFPDYLPIPSSEPDQGVAIIQANDEQTSFTCTLEESSNNRLSIGSFGFSINCATGTGTQTNRVIGVAVPEPLQKRIARPAFGAASGVERPRAPLRVSRSGPTGPEHAGPNTTRRHLASPSSIGAVCFCFWPEPREQEA